MCQTNRSDRFGFRGRLGKRLGDLELEHRPAAVIVGAVVDRIQTNTVRGVQAVEQRADLRPLGVGHLTRLRVVCAALANDRVERADRVVVNGSPDADMIVMRADRDVAIAQLRIAAAQNADDVVRRRLGGTVDEPGVSADRRTRGTNRQLRQRPSENSLGGGSRDKNDRHRSRGQRRVGVPVLSRPPRYCAGTPRSSVAITIAFAPA